MFAARRVARSPAYRRSLRRWLASTVSPAAAVEFGLETQMSNAARRPGAAAVVKISAGRDCVS
eukprot:15456009-Alexandrium_andersonii.AAC.1